MEWFIVACSRHISDFVFVRSFAIAAGSAKCWTQISPRPRRLRPEVFLRTSYIHYVLVINILHSHCRARIIVIIIIITTIVIIIIVFIKLRSGVFSENPVVGRILCRMKFIFHSVRARESPEPGPIRILHVWLTVPVCNVSPRPLEN